MDDLPTELIANIVAHCPINRNSRRRPCLAPYALISKRWQQVVERRLFKSLKIKGSELETFTAICGAGPQREHRRLALQRLEYSIECIPGVDETLKEKPASERAALRQENTYSALQSLDALSSVLRSWSTSRHITLELCLLVQTTFPPGLLNLIPRTKLVKEFVIYSMSPLTTALLEPIASRMDGLQEIKWVLPDGDDTTNSVARRKERYHLSKHLRSLADSCPSLQVIELDFCYDPPGDEYIVVPSILLPHDPVDHLSRSIQRLSLMTKLRTLVLNSFVASKQLFQPCQTSFKSPMWPSLQRLEITFSAAAADGGWLLERDPDPNNYHEDDSDDEEPHFLVRQRRRLIRRHRVQEAEAQTTNFDLGFESEADDDNNDLDVCYCDYFRIWPSQKLEGMLIDMARTATQMPSLRIFTAGLNMPFIAKDQRFDFFYLAPGEKHEGYLWDFPHDSEHRHQRRLYWRVPRSWRMNAELELAWNVSLEQIGRVEYYDWYGEADY